MQYAMTCFNPFEDRLSRDIRNALSSAFASSIETGDSSRLGLLFESYLDKELDGCHREYLQTRKHRYQQALEELQNIREPLAQAVIVWNQELFFEVHELLEHAWYGAKGDYKSTLQAMIRAAGVYVKLECGYELPAKKIAAKAWPVLEINKSWLEEFFDPAPLIAALKDPKVKAPRLSRSPK